MISFAKKILAPGGARQQSLDESGSTKYSLAVAHEPHFTVLGKSFSLNPELGFVAPVNSNRLNGSIDVGMFDGKTDNEASIECRKSTDEIITIMWPTVATSSVTENLEHTDKFDYLENKLQHVDELDLDKYEFSQMHADDKMEPPFGRMSDDISDSMSSLSIAKSSEGYTLEHRAGVYFTRKLNYGRVRVRKGTPEKKVEELFLDRSEKPTRLSLPEADMNSAQYTSTDDIIDSCASVNDCAFEASAVFQQNRMRKRYRKFRMERRTVGGLDLAGMTAVAASNSENSSWFQSKSLTPSPTDLDLGFARQQVKPSILNNVKSKSMTDDLGGKAAAEMLSRNDNNVTGRLTNENVKTNDHTETYQDFLWKKYHSCDDILSDHSKSKDTSLHLDHNTSSCLTTISVARIKEFKLIADIVLLEEGTEFEPCLLYSNAMVVLWPTSVDKPTVTDSSISSQSWIAYLQESGFSGQTCHHCGPAKLSQGLVEQVQYLFLFQDHLLITKQKTSNVLKLERKIPLVHLWLSSRADDVSEISETIPPSEESFSFVLGWPPSNSVATFPTIDEKTFWMTKLEEQISLARSIENSKKQQLIKVVHKERGHSKTKELLVSNNENAASLLQRCLQEFHINPSSSRDYQIYVKWGKDQTFYSLIGHEIPFAIQMSFQLSISNLKSELKKETAQLSFVLRERKNSKHGAAVNKRVQKSSKSTLTALFKRAQPKSTRSSSSGQLFGRSLSESCLDDQIPKPILVLLQYLYIHGPATLGVFRKPGGHKEVNDFKDHMNSGDVNMENASVHVVASVIKDWLRNLPDCLLSCDLYHQWVDASTVGNTTQVKENLKKLLFYLPQSHLLVLRNLVCVLYRIQLYSTYNQMTSFNLAVCIGPNVLRPQWTDDLVVQVQAVSLANAVVQTLIESADYILGQKECIELYLDLGEPSFSGDHLDVEGNYELHSAFAQQFPKINSLESLDEHESFGEAEHDLKKKEASLSFESISPDSGLTASNPQLFDETLINVNQLEPINIETSEELQILTKFELSNVSESQMTMMMSDSDSVSISSDVQLGEPVPSKMFVGSVRECIEKSRNSRKIETLGTCDEQFPERNSLSRSSNIVLMDDIWWMDDDAVKPSSNALLKNEISVENHIDSTSNELSKSRKEEDSLKIDAVDDEDHPSKILPAINQNQMQLVGIDIIPSEHTSTKSKSEPQFMIRSLVGCQNDLDQHNIIPVPRSRSVNKLKVLELQRQSQITANGCEKPVDIVPYRDHVLHKKRLYENNLLHNKIENDKELEKKASMAREKDVERELPTKRMPIASLETVSKKTLIKAAVGENGLKEKTIILSEEIIQSKKKMSTLPNKTSKNAPPHDKAFMASEENLSIESRKKIHSDARIKVTSKEIKSIEENRLIKEEKKPLADVSIVVAQEKRERSKSSHHERKQRAINQQQDYDESKNNGLFQPDVKSKFNEQTMIHRNRYVEEKNDYIEKPQGEKTIARNVDSVNITTVWFPQSENGKGKFERRTVSSKYFIDGGDGCLYPLIRNKEQKEESVQQSPQKQKGREKVTEEFVQNLPHRQKVKQEVKLVQQSLQREKVKQEEKKSIENSPHRQIGRDKARHEGDFVRHSPQREKGREKVKERELVQNSPHRQKGREKVRLEERFLQQSPQREESRKTECETGNRRRVTVIRICDNDSVISQKMIRET